MKRKVLISIVGIAFFAVAIGFGFQENHSTETVKANISALQNAKANATCMSCSPAEEAMCHVGGQTTEGYYCYQAYDHVREQIFYTQ